MEETVADKVVKDISKDFMVRGNHRIHHWYAYAIIGVVLGMAGVMLYIANQNGQFEASQAAKPRGAAIVNRPGAVVKNEVDTAVFDTYLNLAKEEGKKVTMVRVKPLLDFQVIPGDDNDIVRLGGMVVFKLGTPAQLKTLKTFLMNQKFGYDFAFNTDATDKQWHLTYNIPLPTMADANAGLAQGTILVDNTGQKVIAAKERSCTCGAYTLIAKFDAKDTGREIIEMSTSSKPTCNSKTADKGATQCLSWCTAVAKTDQGPTVLGWNMPLESGEAYDKWWDKYFAYTQNSIVIFEATPVCNNQNTVKAPAGR
jgi:hypothetical protein